MSSITISPNIATAGMSTRFATCASRCPTIWRQADDLAPSSRPVVRFPVMRTASSRAPRVVDLAVESRGADGERVEARIPRLPVPKAYTSRGQVEDLDHLCPELVLKESVVADRVLPCHRPCLCAVVPRGR